MGESYGGDSPDALERIFQGPLNWMNLLMVGLNVVVYLVLEVIGDTENPQFMLEWGAAYPPLILDGQWYRLLTSMFLHFGISHLLNNMVLLLFLGDTLEEYAGKWKYLVIYLGGGLAGNLLSLHFNEPVVSAGASGAVFAVIGGVFVILMKHRGRLQNMTASRVLLMAVLSIYYGFQSTGVDNAAHIGGFLGGILLTLLLYRSDSGRSRVEDEW